MYIKNLLHENRWSYPKLHYIVLWLFSHPFTANLIKIHSLAVFYRILFIKLIKLFSASLVGFDDSMKKKFKFLKRYYNIFKRTPLFASNLANGPMNYFPLMATKSKYLMQDYYHNYRLARKRYFYNFYKFISIILFIGSPLETLVTR